MLGGKKKCEKQLEAEKAAARQLMEEAGIDMGHDAAKATVKSTKGAPSLFAPATLQTSDSLTNPRGVFAAAEEKVVAAKEAIVDTKDAAEAKGSRKTGDMKRKMAETKMKLSGRADVSEEEKTRRASEYEPWRVVVKEMKPDWKSLAEKAVALAAALEADQASVRALTEVLCTNVAQDRTRLLLDDESPPGAVGDAVTPMGLFAQRPHATGKFRAAIWREPTWQVLARCNAAGMDCGDAYKSLAESFEPLSLVSDSRHFWLLVHRFPDSFLMGFGRPWREVTRTSETPSLSSGGTGILAWMATRRDTSPTITPKRSPRPRKSAKRTKKRR